MRRNKKRKQQVLKRISQIINVDLFNNDKIQVTLVKAHTSEMMSSSVEDTEIMYFVTFCNLQEKVLQN